MKNLVYWKPLMVSDHHELKGSEDTSGHRRCKKASRALCSSSRHKAPATEPVPTELVMTFWNQNGLDGLVLGTTPLSGGARNLVQNEDGNFSTLQGYNEE